MVNNQNINNKKYYIVGYNCGTNGIFVIFKHVVSHILYALEHDYVPVVDLKHYPNQYFKDGKSFIDNSWEYYFEQPCGINLEDIKDSPNIYIPNVEFWSEKKYAIYPKYIPCSKNETFDYNYLNEYIKYLKFNSETQSYLNDNYKKIFCGETDILGIMVRGTDYTAKKPKGHLIQPSAEQIIRKAKEFYKKYHYKKVFIATEDLNIYNKLKDEFGDMLIENPQYMYNKITQNSLAEEKAERENHNFNLGLEYILSMYLLSKCKYYIGGRANGTIGVFLMTNAFETYKDIYLFDIGRYGHEIHDFLQKLFSLKNSYDKKYKIITILGKKIKFKRRKNGKS